MEDQFDPVEQDLWNNEKVAALASVIVMVIFFAMMLIAHFTAPYAVKYIAAFALVSFAALGYLYGCISQSLDNYRFHRSLKRNRR